MNEPDGKKQAHPRRTTGTGRPVRRPGALELAKDAYLLSLEALLQSKDGGIGGKLIRGEPLTDNEWSHVESECHRLLGRGLGPEHMAALKDVKEWCVNADLVEPDQRETRTK